MADFNTLLNAFVGQSQAMDAAPPAPWQGELMKMVNPEEQRRQNMARALAAASSALGSTPGNFLQGIAAGASQGSTALVDGQQQDAQRRMQAMQMIDQANRQAQSDKLGRLQQALGLVGQQEDRTYQRGQDAAAADYRTKRAGIEDQRWNQEFDLKKMKAGILGGQRPLSPDQKRQARDSVNRAANDFYQRKMEAINADVEASTTPDMHAAEFEKARQQAWADAQEYKRSLMVEYGLSEAPPAGSADAFKSGPTSAGQPDRATVESEAAAALAKGKDPAALRARLTEMGYDPDSFDIWK